MKNFFFFIELAQNVKEIIFFSTLFTILKNKYQAHFNQCLKLEILAMETKCFDTLGSFYRFVFHDPLSMFWGGWGF